jgi:hypothetical protein
MDTPAEKVRQPAARMSFDEWRAMFLTPPADGTTIEQTLTWVVWNIHQLMDGEEWSPDTLDSIAMFMREAGFELLEPVIDGGGDDGDD